MPNTKLTLLITTGVIFNLGAIFLAGAHYFAPRPSHDLVLPDALPEQVGNEQPQPPADPGIKADSTSRSEDTTMTTPPRTDVTDSASTGQDRSGEKPPGPTHDQEVKIEATVADINKFNQDGAVKTFNYDDGRIQYKGEVKNGKKDGQGTYYLLDGRRYEGHWTQGLRDGQGTLFYANGAIEYTGNWRNDKKDGTGTNNYEDGTSYTGEWKQGGRDGAGILYDKNKSAIYKGDWANGSREGNGTYVYDDGTFYKGSWARNLRNGKGTLYYSNGHEMYVGDWKDDTIDDTDGIYYFNNGRVYRGAIRYADGTYYGSGVLTLTDGTQRNAHWNGSSCIAD